MRHDQDIDGFELVAWMNEDGDLLAACFKDQVEKQKFSTKDYPFSGYDIPLYRKKQDERTI